MKKATWKILMLAVLTVLLVGLTSTALATNAWEVNNAFSFSRKGTATGTTTYSLGIPLETDAKNLTIIVNNNHTGTNGAEIQVDELRFKTWSTVPGAKYEQTLDAKNGPSSASYSVSNIAKSSYSASVEGYSTTKNVPFYMRVTGNYKIALNVYVVNVNIGDKVGFVGYYCADSAKTWASSNKKVATVDKDGMVTAKAAGVAKITLSAEGQSVTAIVNVLPGDMNDRTMGFDQVLTLSLPNYGDQVTKIEWNSTNSTIASVDEKGKVTSHKKEGTVSIIATLTLADSSTKDVTCKVTVKKGASGTSASTGASVGKMVVRTGNWAKLHLRKAKSKSSASLGLYPNGTIVNVTANDGTWATVTVGGKSGFMMSRYLKPTDASASDSGDEGESSSSSTTGAIAAGKVCTVKGAASSIHFLRSSPSTADNTNVIAKIPGQSKVTMVEWGRWYSKVKYGSKTGFIVTSHIKP